MKLHALFEQKNGVFQSCAVSGHALWDEDDLSGQILCAAVSSAMQLTCNTLTECFGAQVQITEHPAEGAENLLAFRLRSPDSVQSELLHGLLIHLQVLAEEYDGMMTVTVREQ